MTGRRKNQCLKHAEIKTPWKGIQEPIKRMILWRMCTIRSNNLKEEEGSLLMKGRTKEKSED